MICCCCVAGAGDLGCGVEVGSARGEAGARSGVELRCAATVSTKAFTILATSPLIYFISIETLLLFIHVNEGGEFTTAKKGFCDSGLSCFSSFSFYSFYILTW